MEFEASGKLYAERDDWKDVVPVPQDDGPHPVVRIAYAKEFEDVYNYFRAVLKSGEKSERALELTRDAIYKNAANYTVWEVRRQILVALKKDLKDELNFCSYVIELHPKNYQVWHHRLCLVEMLNDPSGEKELTSRSFAEDAKNYHAWQHRLWCVRTYSLYDGELEFTEDMIRGDLRNNSAWNYRYSIIQDTTKFNPEVIEREIKFTIEKIKLAPNNESAWNYLKGVLFQKGGLASSDFADAFCQELYRSGCRASHLLACMVEILGDKLSSKKDQTLLEEALKLCTELAEQEDTIRSEYWNYVKRRYTSKYGG
jgi:protein farnesyltransferase/geranylgeranyltransferase type-1 subunit alpha